MIAGGNKDHRHLLEKAEVVTENTDATLERGMIAERKVIITVTIMVERIDASLRRHLLSLPLHLMRKEERSIKNIISVRDVIHHLQIEVQV
jgi:hypothetical protein